MHKPQKFGRHRMGQAGPRHWKQGPFQYFPARFRWPGPCRPVARLLPSYIQRGGQSSQEHNGCGNAPIKSSALRGQHS